MSRDILPRRLGADTFFVSAFTPIVFTCGRDRIVFLRRSIFVLRFVTRNGEILLLPCGSIPLFATAPFVSETSSLTVIHFMSGNAWSYLRLVAYGFLGLSERA